MTYSRGGVKIPHITVEYTDNLKEETNISLLLKSLNEVLIARSPTFPIGGIRSRAIELQHYYVADGSQDDAFVHVTLKIGAGRSDEVKQETSQAMFDVITTHFSEVFNRRSLALSLELVEFSEAGTFKKNNIHKRFK
ncbi:5-carboxymethyl-2-hydroxymuconate Delta-isomerase [Paenisporosarcina antarctica]|uniref:5-carboxymethyl-2-hydroxymuconate Delta-isomerase n=1 Tax=Paenisporosarcina antarctica TaxID=417367 RepID=UPI001AB04732|nr:5-carboxymethyl-2-hydroxymuconate Delta-isomerase [Paenisporosarcina antarctica]